MSLHSDWSSIEELPTGLDTEEDEVIEIDEDEAYEPPEPIYEPASPRPEPREEGPRAPNIFTDNSNASGRGEESRERSKELASSPGKSGIWIKETFLGKAKPT